MLWSKSIGVLNISTDYGDYGGRNFSIKFPSIEESFSQSSFMSKRQGSRISLKSAERGASRNNSKAERESSTIISSKIPKKKVQKKKRVDER